MRWNDYNMHQMRKRKKKYSLVIKGMEIFIERANVAGVKEVLSRQTLCYRRMRRIENNTCRKLFSQSGIQHGLQF